jgi:hypothetical protein
VTCAYDTLRSDDHLGPRNCGERQESKLAGKAPRERGAPRRGCVATGSRDLQRLMPCGSADSGFSGKLLSHLSRCRFRNGGGCLRVSTRTSDCKAVSTISRFVLRPVSLRDSRIERASILIVVLLIEAVYDSGLETSPWIGICRFLWHRHSCLCAFAVGRARPRVAVPPRCVGKRRCGPSPNTTRTPS